MKSGWYKESYRHTLAARGISTSKYYSRKNPSTGVGPARVPPGTRNRLSGRYSKSQRVEELAKSLNVFEKGPEAKARASKLYKEIENRKESGESTAALSRELHELQGVGKSRHISPAGASKVVAASQLLRDDELNLSPAEKLRVVNHRKALLEAGQLDTLKKMGIGASRIPKRSTITRSGKPSAIVAERREEMIDRAAHQQELALTAQMLHPAKSRKSQRVTKHERNMRGE